MFDVDESRLEDIAYKYNRNYSDVFDDVMKESKKLYSNTLHNAILRKQVGKAFNQLFKGFPYSKATDNVEKKYFSQHNATKPTNISAETKSINEPKKESAEIYEF